MSIKKRTTFSIKISLYRTLIRQLKGTINQCKKIYMRKKTFFLKNVLLNTINNIGMVLEIIIIKFICTLIIMSRNTFPEPQPDSALYCEILNLKLRLHRNILLWPSTSSWTGPGGSPCVTLTGCCCWNYHHTPHTWLAGCWCWSWLHTHHTCPPNFTPYKFFTSLCDSSSNYFRLVPLIFRIIRIRNLEQQPKVYIPLYKKVTQKQKNKQQTKK